jgi:hypothetical protein
MKASLIWGYRPAGRYRLFQRGPNWWTLWIKPVALMVTWPTWVTCLGNHKWKGSISSCCPQCNRRASAKVYG